MKSQRIKITQAGWATFSDYLCGVKFENGLSEDMVPPSVIAQIGSIMSIEGADDMVQVGMGSEVLANMSNTAPVEVVADPGDAGAAAAKSTAAEKYTRESLEEIADQKGIAGLRAIADSYGVKGRGIVELIGEILKAQG